MKNSIILISMLAVTTIPIHATYRIDNDLYNFAVKRYSLKAKEAYEYRDYENSAPERVKEFYKSNHTNQTLAFVRAKKKEYGSLNKKKMGIWQVVELLDTFVDQSDPDLDLPQSYHAFQTAEALRKDGHPRWLILTGFIHDLGKVLMLFGEPQWAIVGDTFPLGCAFSEKIVFHRFFTDNPDIQNITYQTKCGMYAPHFGLNNVHMSWGHDEYLYQVMKNYLPEQALYIIRYHSFYALHKEGVYDYLMNDYDEKMITWLKLFSQYDLYSKNPKPFDVDVLRHYYEELVAEFLPDELNWQISQ